MRTEEERRTKMQLIQKSTKMNEIQAENAFLASDSCIKDRIIVK